MKLRAAAFGLALIMSPMPALGKTIDLRNMTETSGTYEVSFCARPSPGALELPGHMFVAFSHIRPGGTREFLSIGHTVAAGVSSARAAWSYFGDGVPGFLAEENYTHIRQNCLAAQVNKAVYDRARDEARPYLSRFGVDSPSTVYENYSLGSADCMTFALKVAELLEPYGLTVPERGSVELPAEYTERLIAANSNS